MGPPPPQLKNSIFGPAGPRDPLRILGRIGGNRSPLFPSKSVVIGPIFGQKNGLAHVCSSLPRLISNLAVDQVSFFWLSDPSLFHIREEPPALQRFANGTQGRLLQWHPAANESKRRALPAYCPDLLARFCKAGRSRGAHSWCRRHGGVEIRSGVRLIFPSFVAGDPTSFFLPESRRPRCPRGR